MLLSSISHCAIILNHTVFGVIVEGLDTLNRINEAYADKNGRPFKDFRIKHTCILDDPFTDPPK